MKKTSTLILRNSLLLLATLFAFSITRATAQTTAQTKLAAPRITQAIDETKLVPMHSKVHPLARAEFDRGVVPDSQPMNRIILNLQRSDVQERALRNLMDEQQTKNSPNYHAWLTPAQFGQQFGVADADIQKVTAWLSQKGFTGIKPSAGQMFIEFSGTAGLVRNAFHTEIHSFMVNGEAHVANVSVPQMPAALAPVVSGIHSLHNFRKKSFMHYSQALAKAKADGELKPGFGEGNGLFAVAPGDFAKIYNLPSGLTGSGQTIALVARSNITVSDINQFGTAFGIANLTSFTAANNIILSGADPGVQPPDDGEATLDVEWSGAEARGVRLSGDHGNGRGRSFRLLYRG
jgi:subtilase family serine protease